MSASGPYGKWTKSDLADELNISRGYFSQVVLEKGCPELVPDLIAGRQHLYGDHTAESWLADYRRWREEEPARKAAKRADDDARARYAREAEMARINAADKVARAMQEATDAALVEEAARQERALKGIW